MKHAPLPFLLAFGGLFLWFAPDHVREEASAAPSAEAQPTARPTVRSIQPSRTTAQSGWDVVLPRAADGHFYAEVVVDAASTRMLVDTGASVVALTAEDADAIGITWDAAQLAPVARGVGGEVDGVRVMLDRVQIGSLEARHVEAVVVPEGLEVSLLGQSFLAKVARVEIDQQKMVLGS
jgi:aspartyl protease family protein